MDMPTKKRTLAAQAAARGPFPELQAELIEHLPDMPMSASEVQDLFLSFQKAVIERMMNAEMSQHLGTGPVRTSPKGKATSATAPAARP